MMNTEKKTNEQVLTCPFLSCMGRAFLSCMGEECALFHKKIKMCAFLMLADIVCDINAHLMGD